MANKFINGCDISSLIELEELGAKFYDFSKKEVELAGFLSKNGFNSMRIRLWIDPYSEEGKPYLGGTNDLDKALELASRAKANKMSIMLDFHYSDFWVDPSKQTLPKEWKNLGFVELANKIYSYTEETLQIFKKKGYKIDYVQIGNEITNGMLWPIGKLYEGDKFIEENFSHVATFLKAGISATKEIYPKAKTIIHLERSGYTEIYDHYLGLLEKYHVEYDILGMSYYPYWHKDMANLEKTLDLIKNKYHKEMMVVEYSYCYSEKKLYDTKKEELPLIIKEGKENVLTNEVDYPFTVEGQINFIKDLYKLLKKYDVLGMYYWEPAWIQVDGTSWASLEAMDYINEHKPFGNEWANQGLFDSMGHPIESLNIFRSIGGKKE